VVIWRRILWMAVVAAFALAAPARAGAPRPGGARADDDGPPVAVGDAEAPLRAFDRFMARIDLSEDQKKAWEAMSAEETAELRKLYVGPDGRRVRGAELRVARAKADAVSVEYRRKLLKLLTDAQRGRIESIARAARPPVERPFDEIVDELRLSDEVWSGIGARREAAAQALNAAAEERNVAVKDLPVEVTAPLRRSYRSEVRKLLEPKLADELGARLLRTLPSVSYALDREIRALEPKPDKTRALVELREQYLDRLPVPRVVAGGGQNWDWDAVEKIRTEYAGKALAALTADERSAVEDAVYARMVASNVRWRIMPDYLRTSNRRIARVAKLTPERAAKLDELRHSLEKKLAGDPAMQELFAFEREHGFVSSAWMPRSLRREGIQPILAKLEPHRTAAEAAVREILSADEIDLLSAAAGSRRRPSYRRVAEPVSADAIAKLGLSDEKKAEVAKLDARLKAALAAAEKAKDEKAKQEAYLRFRAELARILGADEIARWTAMEEEASAAEKPNAE